MFYKFFTKTKQINYIWLTNKNKNKIFSVIFYETHEKTLPIECYLYRFIKALYK